MTSIAQVERETQNRVVALLDKELLFKYLGNWKDRENNSNIETSLLAHYLSAKKGYDKNIIEKALYELGKVAGDQSKNLYDINKAVYSLLRYGIDVQPETGRNKTTVELIDWKNPLANDFAFAEEVTVRGVHDKRPDIVVYVNGIALAVMELKRSTVSISEGIRQSLDNQKQIFIQQFFSTVQLVIAGNDFEGLAYGVVLTKEKYFQKWKEVCEDADKNDAYLLDITKKIRKKAEKCRLPLDKNIVELFDRERFLEIIHDFMTYDRGDKKVARPNQYFGVKAAQDFVRRKEGGIIWHTQGSGKSLTMVWLTRWIREHNPDARVLVLTDRDELDEQIEKVYIGVDEKIYRTKSGRDLFEKLHDNAPWLLCSLIHKFGGKEEEDEGDVEAFVRELKSNIPSDFKAKGDIHVFVDECHRTQSGKLHAAMKEFLPDALFIGFTGTPILKSDKQTTMKIFGRFIHTYKYDEAVADGVVLDLRYEARDVEQKITAPEKIDEWFDLKTRGLTDHAKAELKQKWGTIKKVFSSKSRLEKIVMDIMLDMERKERLRNGRGNALLVSDSIYNACRYYELFRKAGLQHCAIVTSYVPSHKDIKGEETGQGDTEKLERFEIYRKMLSEYYHEDSEKALKKVEQFETEVKKKFVEEPAQMKLLIVVSMLLTGFDAPSATYLYIDKKLRDHGLFQAVCRVNRLHDEDKDYGYIVDYMDLFKSLEDAFKDYTSEALSGYDKADVEGLLKDRLKQGKERLDDAIEAAKALCEPIEPPKDLLAHVHYFCGDTQKPEDLMNTEPRRVSLYKLTILFLRAYSSIADEMEEAGYTKREAENIRTDIKNFSDIRKAVQIASKDYIDLKQYEPAMRYLIDSYIGAEDSRVLVNFDNMSLVELLVEKGKAAIDDLPENMKRDKEASAEAIENNMRRVIIEERPTNPAYYDKMSVLLDEIIRNRKERTSDYEKYLKQIIELSIKVKRPESAAGYPNTINTPARRALYDNLEHNEALASELDSQILATKKDGWKDNIQKTRAVEHAICEVLEKHQVKEKDLKYILDIVRSQNEY